MNIHIEKGIRAEHAELLCAWSNRRGEAFQRSWTGSGLDYPLTAEKVLGLESLFSIFGDDEFLGVIQKIRSEENSVHIGRFLIHPEKRGQGLGRQALRLFTEEMFADAHIRSISLTVSEANEPAKHLYETLGFRTEEVIEKPERKRRMRKRREA